jgi:hypothetical protein
MREWWFNDTGDNTLKGVEGDEANPIRLQDAFIRDFLRMIPDARASFERVVPTMLEDEKARLIPLAATVSPITTDVLENSDGFQHHMNGQGIHVQRPRRRA